MKWNFELVVVLIQCILLGVQIALFWVELRHKINTEWGRWGALIFCCALNGAYLFFG